MRLASILYLFLLTGSLNAQDPKVWEGVPEPVCRIIWKCTKMDPDDRYQTCEELKKAVLLAKKKEKELPQKLAAAAVGALGMLAVKGFGLCLKVCRQRTKKQAGAVIIKGKKKETGSS